LSDTVQVLTGLGLWHVSHQLYMAFLKVASDLWVDIWQGRDCPRVIWACLVGACTRIGQSVQI